MKNIVSSILHGLGALVILGVVLMGMGALVSPPSSGVSVAPQENISRKEVKVEDKANKILHLTVDPGRTLFLYGPVMNNAVDLANKIRDLNKTSKDPIYLLIDSPGGDVMTGSQLITAMEASVAPVYTVCMGLCASMAAITLEYGTKRYAVNRSTVMLHNAAVQASLQGDISRAVNRLTHIETFVKTINTSISHKLGMKLEDYEAMVTHELWLTSPAALDKGLLDSLVWLDNLPVNKQVEDATAKAKNKLNETIEVLW